MTFCKCKRNLKKIIFTDQTSRATLVLQTYTIIIYRMQFMANAPQYEHFIHFLETALETVFFFTQLTTLNVS